MLLKEVYNQEFLKSLSEAIFEIDKNFDIKNFLKISQEKEWRDLALKQRMRAITIAIDKYLSVNNSTQKAVDVTLSLSKGDSGIGLESPFDKLRVTSFSGVKVVKKTYIEKVEVLKKSILKISKDKNSGLALIIFPDFIEVFGCQEYRSHANKTASLNFSMQALEFFTEFGTSEFAVRQFVKLDQKSSLKIFSSWAKSKNYHVRRLASEGLRPRLPWGESLPEFKKNPLAILPILEELKNDEFEYVRRSVANNLNDISKDHPQVILNLMNNWQKDVDPKLIKHALRTLLKSGNKEALEIIGVKTDLKTTQNFLIKNFDLKKTEIKIGEILEFDFALQNQSSAQNIRLEYVIYFLRKNGGYSKKIFQVTSKNFPQGVFNFYKKHSFKNLTTRNHYCGEHLISLVVNGFEVDKRSFELME